MKIKTDRCDGKLKQNNNLKCLKIQILTWHFSNIKLVWMIVTGSKGKPQDDYVNGTYNMKDTGTTWL